MATFVGIGSNSGNVSSLNVTIPAGAAVGDVAWLFWCGGTTVTPTDPTGWTSRANTTAGTANLRRYTRTIQSGDAGSVLTLVSSAGQKQVAFIMVWSGVDTTTPEHAETPAAVTSTATTATRTNPTVTTAGTRSMMSAVSDRGSTSGTWTQPAGWTLDGNLSTATSGSVSGAVAHRTSAAGNYGGDTWTSSSAVQAQAVTEIVVIKDATLTPPTANVTTTDGMLIDATGSTAGHGGSLSYSITQTSGTTFTPVSVATGKWFVGRTTADRVYRVTVTEDTTTATYDVTVSPASSGDGYEIRTRIGGVWT